MIGVEGQFIAVFSVGGITDFVNTDQVVKFQSVETVGITLPEFMLSFVIEDDRILRYLNEGNTLRASMGKTLNTLEDYEMYLSKVDVETPSSALRVCTVFGTINAPDYLQEDFYHSEEGSSLTVMESMLSGVLRVDSNVVATQDSQIWINPYMSRKAFLKELWLHSWKPGTFIGMGITNSKKLLVKDMRAQAALPARWNFVSNSGSLGPRDVRVMSNGSIVNESGFVNTTYGSGRDRQVTTLPTGISELNKGDIISVLTKNNTRSSAKPRQFAPRMQNPNQHSNYWKAYSNNLASLSTLGQSKLTVTTGTEFIDIELMDKINVKNPEVSPESSQSNEEISGHYFTTLISRVIEQGTAYMTIGLGRESFNRMRGNLA